MNQITFFASVLIWLMFAGLVFVYIFDGNIRKEAVLHGLVASGISWFLSEVIKNIIPVERPFVINGLESLTLTKPLDPSFPSGHTASAFALAVTLWLHDRRVGAIYLIFAALVGAGRILSNVHYPIDIWVGAVLGSSVALVIERRHVVSSFIKRRKQG